MISPPTCASRSSFVVPALSDTGRLLRDLARVLREGGRRWYVFGAQAVIAHGLPRATADVDVTLKLDPEDPASGRATCSRRSSASLRAHQAIQIELSSAPLPSNCVQPWRAERTASELYLVPEEQARAVATAVLAQPAILVVSSPMTS